MTHTLNIYISGALTMGCVVVALFFQQFGRKTNDKLFQVFSLAFWLFAIERAALIALNTQHEERSYIYLIRLVAYLLIIFAILGKNLIKKPTYLSSNREERSSRH